MAQIQFSLIEKIKIGCPEHALTPYPPTSDNNPTHFYLTPPPPPKPPPPLFSPPPPPPLTPLLPSKWTSYVYHP